MYGVSLFPYLWMFLLAALASEKKDKVIPILKKWWWLFIFILILNTAVVQLDVKLSLYPIINTVLRFGGFVGFAYAFPRINVKRDISYGVYIYHMTIVNALIALGFVGESWTLWFVIVLTCLLAWISTITIGKLSLSKKQKN